MLHSWFLCFRFSGKFPTKGVRFTVSLINTCSGSSDPGCTCFIYSFKVLFWNLVSGISSNDPSNSIISFKRTAYDHSWKPVWDNIYALFDNFIG